MGKYIQNFTRDARNIYKVANSFKSSAVVSITGAGILTGSSVGGENMIGLKKGESGEVEGGIGMGNTCKSMADSCQCMTKTTTIL